ncbi:MAG: transposase, partial [Ignavibacteriae bacterium]|nr:transposase [Ignavibacteriota bacterium]
MMTFDSALDSVMQLSPEQRMKLVDIVRKRYVEERRLEIAAHVEEGLDLFRAGKLRSESVDDLLARLHASLNEPLNLILSATLENIRTLSRHIKELDRAIEREVRKFPNPLISVPGLGPVLVARLMAEIQDIHRFPDQAAWPNMPASSGVPTSPALSRPRR